MTEILPEGEQRRRATIWISARRTEEPGASLQKLIEEACIKFDLSPKDCDLLVHLFTAGQKKQD